MINNDPYEQVHIEVLKSETAERLALVVKEYLDSHYADAVTDIKYLYAEGMYVAFIHYVTVEDE